MLGEANWAESWRSPLSRLSERLRPETGAGTDAGEPCRRTDSNPTRRLLAELTGVASPDPAATATDGTADRCHPVPGKALRTETGGVGT
jgi:hypothetical protein